MKALHISALDTFEGMRGGEKGRSSDSNGRTTSSSSTWALDDLPLDAVLDIQAHVLVLPKKRSRLQAPDGQHRPQRLQPELVLVPPAAGCVLKTMGAEDARNVLLVSHCINDYTQLTIELGLDALGINTTVTRDLTYISRKCVKVEPPQRDNADDEDNQPGDVKRFYRAFIDQKSGSRNGKALTHSNFNDGDGHKSTSSSSSSSQLSSPSKDLDYYSIPFAEAEAEALERAREARGTPFNIHGFQHSNIFWRIEGALTMDFFCGGRKEIDDHFNRQKVESERMALAQQLQPVPRIPRRLRRPPRAVSPLRSRRPAVRPRGVLQQPLPFNSNIIDGRRRHNANATLAELLSDAIQYLEALQANLTRLHTIEEKMRRQASFQHRKAGNALGRHKVSNSPSGIDDFSSADAVAALRAECARLLIKPIPSPPTLLLPSHTNRVKTCPIATATANHHNGRLRNADKIHHPSGSSDSTLVPATDVTGQKKGTRRISTAGMAQRRSPSSADQHKSFLTLAAETAPYIPPSERDIAPFGPPLTCSASGAKHYPIAFGTSRRNYLIASSSASDTHDYYAPTDLTPKVWDFNPVFLDGKRYLHMCGTRSCMMRSVACLTSPSPSVARGGSANATTSSSPWALFHIMSTCRPNQNACSPAVQFPSRNAD